MILTDEEITEIIDRGDVVEGNRYLPFSYARAIEAKILEKQKAVEPVGTFWHDDKDNEWGININDGAVIEQGANLYTRPSPSIPEGWQLVPVEPTDQMLCTGGDYFDGDSFAAAKKVWKAMLAAAPKVTK